MAGTLLLALGLLFVGNAFGAYPNVIVMLVDDMGVNDIGYVNEEVISPNIDKLAKEGITLNNNYVMNACTPTRHALLTGRHPFQSQMQHIVLMLDQAHCSPTDLTFLPQRFQSLGYNTYMTGKWHLGFCQKACLPTNRGFDHFYGYYQGGQDYYTKSMGGGYDWRDGDELDWSVNGIYDTYIMDEWLKKQFTDYDSSTPFFLYLSWPNVHDPIQSPTDKDSYQNLFTGSEYDYMTDERKDYLRVLYTMDEAIGNLTSLLDANGLLDNTLIVFSSDNGAVHGGVASNMPYRGSKGSFWEGGVRAQAFAWGSMLNTGGEEHDGLFHVSDWHPTIMSIIGEPLDDPDMYGIDQSDMIVNGGPSKRDEIIFNIDMNPKPMMGQAAMRRGDWKFIWGNPGTTDGWGTDVFPLYDDPDNLWMIGMDPSTVEHGPTAGDAPFDFGPLFTAIETALCYHWGFNYTSTDGGLVNLFNLADDPYEYTNLAYDSDQQDRVLEFKEYILSQLDSYRGAPPEGLVNRKDAADPANFDGAWSSGWCEDLDIVMANSALISVP